jgi:hypothetical protein
VFRHGYDVHRTGYLRLIGQRTVKP